MLLYVVVDFADNYRRYAILMRVYAAFAPMLLSASARYARKRVYLMRSIWR